MSDWGKKPTVLFIVKIKFLTTNHQKCLPSKNVSSLHQYMYYTQCCLKSYQNDGLSMFQDIALNSFFSQNTVFGKPVNVFMYHINVRLKFSNICLNLHWSFPLVDKICYMYLNIMAERWT